MRASLRKFVAPIFTFHECRSPDTGGVEQKGDDVDSAIGDDGLVGKILRPAGPVEKGVHDGIEREQHVRDEQDAEGRDGVLDGRSIGAQ